VQIVFGRLTVHVSAKSKTEKTRHHQQGSGYHQPMRIFHLGSTSFPLRPQPELDQALMAPSAEPVGHRNTATTVGSGPDSVAQCHFLRNPRSRKYSVNSFSTKDVRDR
jgi:hypothetical protein